MITSLLYKPYTTLRATFPSADLKNRRCLLRIDGNVPTGPNGNIADDSRLRAALPTLQALVAQGARVTIATHWGSPHPQKHDSSTCFRDATLEPLVAWFTQQDYGPAQRISWLENLRCFPGEQHHDAAWARTITSEFDYYIDDAFGSLHRNDASLVEIPLQFSPQSRSIGLLVERELHALATLTTSVRRPLIVILGGGKIEKAAYLPALCTRADRILLAPAMHTAQMQAATSACAIERPLDYVVELEGDTIIIDDPFYRETAITIGPKTVQRWSSLVAQAGTVLMNGISGFEDHPATLDPILTVITAACVAGATVIAGGGSTSETLSTHNLRSQVTFCSTGGGALLALMGGQRLAALDLFLT